MHWRLHYLNNWKELIELDFETLEEVFKYVEEVKPRNFKCKSLDKEEECILFCLCSMRTHMMKSTPSYVKLMPGHWNRSKPKRNDSISAPGRMFSRSINMLSWGVADMARNGVEVLTQGWQHGYGDLEVQQRRTQGLANAQIQGNVNQQAQMAQWVNPPTPATKPTPLACTPEVMEMYAFPTPHLNPGPISIGYKSAVQTSWPQRTSHITIRPPHQFNCCGASIIEGIGSVLDGDKRESFVCMLRRSVMDSQTFYFIAADYQLADKYTVANLLRELGAREVDSSPNRNHGPHMMLLHVWTPVTTTMEIWGKYITYGSQGWVPNWWNKLSSEKQKALVEQAKPRADFFAAQAVKDRDLKLKHAKQDRIYSAEDCLAAGELTPDILAKYGYVKKGK